MEKAHPDQKLGNKTYAQRGEDLMILNIFEIMGISRPSYLDIGAHHPFHISNTGLLYELGCRGVNVEANPDLFAPFQMLRPEDINLNIGVGPKAMISTFYRYSGTSGRNTFSEEEVARCASLFKVRNTMELCLTTIDSLVRDYCAGVYPDLLTMDIEGLDLAVLKSADFSKTYPKLVVVEARSETVHEFINVMHEKDFFCYCRMGENLFFIHRSYQGAMWKF